MIKQTCISSYKTDYVRPGHILYFLDGGSSFHCSVAKSNLFDSPGCLMLTQ